MIELVSVEMCCSLTLSPPISDLLVAVQSPAISRFLMNEVRLIEKLTKSGVGRDPLQRGQAVDRDPVGLEFVDEALDCQ